MSDFDYFGKISIILFVVSLILFVTTSLPPTLVALLLLTTGVVLGLPKSLLLHSFNQDIIWLMIGAFMISGVLEQSGLIQRMTMWVLKQGHTRKMNRLIFGLVQLVSIVIPSTSSRAVILLPLYQQIIAKLPQFKTFYSLVFPVLILMGSNLTLLGAGSHLIGMGLLQAQNKETLSYFEFLYLAAPFGIVIAIISVWVIYRFTHMRHVTIHVDTHTEISQPYTRHEKKTLLLLILTIIFWLTEWLHQIDIAVVTFFIALIMTLPIFNMISFKESLKFINWNLILFVAAASALGTLLVEYKVIDQLQESLFSRLTTIKGIHDGILLILICIITVLSHLIITSHTTRAVVLIPSFLVLSELYHLNATSVVFIALIGMNYCLTFPVSSKALLVFFEGHAGFTSKQLIQLSLILTPVYIMLMVLFYYCYWQPIGLTL
ncbi:MULTISPECIES: SLC13 family permease [unclassified Staphylococcus]|uniref:SLC13 family permease n=1 Tax=unclassified Staphylococcus TaxID=91994 RepID=UPI0021D18F4A|nr:MULTISPECIES: SLC13 family permease [unclassified Staphylococcus]UXR77944.1 anion permease [Staphylococcus sp. IVB6227]UXR82105.1 anion permease [Staphylococcus sp. IVB6214]